MLDGIRVSGVVAVWFILLAVTQLMGTPTSDTQTMNFHVQGVISSPWDSEPQIVTRSAISFHGKPVAATDSTGGSSDSIPMPRSEVTFSSDKISHTVVVDKHGFYQLDLPLGVYKMVAEGPTIGNQSLVSYERLFRVSSPSKIELNGSLLVAPSSCDTVTTGLPIERAIEIRKNDCGGVDLFPMPAKSGTQFQLYVRYPERQSTAEGLLYGNARVATSGGRVLLAYNLFSLEANVVNYKSDAHTVLATGDVVIEDGSGVSRHTTSATFRLQDGNATALN